MRKGEGGGEGWLELLMSNGGAAASDADLAQRPTVPLGEGLTGWAAKTGIAVVERDASMHTAYSRRYEQPVLGKAPVLCVPVKPRQRGDRVGARGRPAGGRAHALRQVWRSTCSFRA